MEQSVKSIKSNSTSKANCFNDFNSFMLCKGLVRELYWDDTECKDLEKKLFKYCSDTNMIKKYTNYIKLKD